MKIQIASDLHIEVHNNYPIIEPKCDYLILAGDIGEIGNTKYEEFLEYVNRNWKKVIMVLGNHEFYSKDKSYEEKLIENREFFKKYDNIFLLEKDSTQLEEYTVIGLTLWSKLKRNSHASIKKIKWRENGDLIKIGIDKLNEQYEESKLWLTKNYNKTKPTIIVTHYPLTLEESYVRPKCFSNEPLEWLKEFGSEYFLETPKNKLICISGHTHFSHNFIDCSLNDTRFISNQFGYSNEKYTRFKEDCLFRLKSKY